ncbi:hypothetical protein JYJ95_38445 [Corallococcus exiguus]|uniref:hypothetical protein n=1 Tax=Corallococcus exiguus TaxID=83462 RepID=UPI001A900950|nr:hypothetical protein [Corallococcus exiguus]MBN8472419.1 hypothetical protein [Corallococcus exiguus]
MMRTRMVMGRLLTAAMVGAFAGCRTETSKEAAPESTSQGITATTDGCVNRFEGITHCATGNASLEDTDEGLVVAGLDSLDEDGVVGAVGQAESWRQRSIVDFGEDHAGVAYYGRNEDQVISTLRMTTNPERPGFLRLQPMFTGSPGGSNYTVTVWDHGEPTAYKLPFGYLDDLNLFLSNIHHVPHYLTTIFEQEEGGLFSAGDTQGACIWRMRFQDESFQLTLDDGTEVTGDEIEFVEQLADGAYPYSYFTHIGMTGAVDKFTVLEEVVTLNGR